MSVELGHHVYVFRLYTGVVVRCVYRCGGMASQSKRGHLMRSATYRSRTDISADWAEGGDSKPETSLRGLTGPNDQATGSSHTVCDRVSLALASERQPGEGLPPELAPSARGDAAMGGGDFRHARLG